MQNYKRAFIMLLCGYWIDKKKNSTYLIQHFETPASEFLWIGLSDCLSVCMVVFWNTHKKTSAALAKDSSGHV